MEKSSQMHDRAAANDSAFGIRHSTFPWDALPRVIRDGLAEDVAGGDVTTDLLFGNDGETRAVFRAKQDGVLAGLPAALQVFRTLDPATRLTALAEDGQRVSAAQELATVEGRRRVVLTGERLALNLLQRMSGIATLARRYVDAVAGLPVTILDTRKTAPGLRALDKYAVRCGGATNHRLNLHELAMVKDNHLKLAGGIGPAVARLRAQAPGLRIEVETANLDQVREALAAGADIIMLDNMDLATMRAAVHLVAGQAQVEASGSIALDQVRAVAETGINVISIGRLTHSAPALDISMKVV
jgi:nicotinate-nucleotide pyrophosphorylase (carboxylating)